jgi:hypothetical protein
MRAHESSHDHDGEGPRRATAFRPADSRARADALTPDLVLRLQRTAGNAAVASALAVQRKKQQEIDAGTINGILSVDGKDHPLSSINITDGWIS